MAPPKKGIELVQLSEAEFPGGCCISRVAEDN